MGRTRIVIMGAAGRDFHNFQVVYRDDPSVEVVAFTATQIPGIDNRLYPPALAGPLYPEGITIVPESALARVILEHRVHQVVFAYSDISHEEVMHRASLAMANGADFVILGPERTMLKAAIPVISVCAVRTGCGKSGLTERIWEILDGRSVRAVVLRHPMPYSDLSRMRVERFATMGDLDRYGCTVEEREEYEHFVSKGIVVYAGVDYQAILKEAQEEAQVILWDGGNNDFPFLRPDLEIVVLDPHRSGHERLYHPGEVNLRRAHVLVINKLDSARPEDVRCLEDSVAQLNPSATVVRTASRISVQRPEEIRGKRVLVVEDGPTLTHGGMPFGAGVLAARMHGASEIVDPRPFAAGSIKACLESYPHLRLALPAVGYFPEQLRDLEASVASTPCDLVLVATPIDLTRLIKIPQPTQRVVYRIEELGGPTIEDVVSEFLERCPLIFESSQAGTNPGQRDP
jgi:predicted GTPase